MIKHAWIEISLTQFAGTVDLAVTGEAGGLSPPGDRDNGNSL